MRAYLKMLKCWLADAGAPRDAARHLTKVPVALPHSTIARPGELKKMLAIANPWLRAFIIIAAGHGLRFAETRNLARCHYNEQIGVISYPTKGNRSNILPASDELRELFKAAPPSVLSIDQLTD